MPKDVDEYFTHTPLFIYKTFLDFYVIITYIKLYIDNRYKNLLS